MHKMAKDTTQSKIPRLDSVTRIPVPGSIRTSRNTTADIVKLQHPHLQQKTQLINVTSTTTGTTIASTKISAPLTTTTISCNEKLARPSSITGLRIPSVITSIKQPLTDGERINETVCLLNKKSSNTVKIFSTKPSSSTENTTFTLPSDTNTNSLEEVTDNVNENSPKTSIKDETIILDKLTKDDVNQKLMTTQVINCQQQQNYPSNDNKNVVQIEQLQQKITSNTNIANITKTLTRSETFIREKKDETTSSIIETHNNLPDIDQVTTIMESNIQQQYKKINSDSINYENNTFNVNENTYMSASPITSLKTRNKISADKNYSYERLSDTSIPNFDLDSTLVPSTFYGAPYNQDTEGTNNDAEVFGELNKDVQNVNEDDLQFDNESANNTTNSPHDKTMKVFNSTFNSEVLVDISSHKFFPEFKESPNINTQNNTKLLYLTNCELDSNTIDPNNKSSITHNNTNEEEEEVEEHLDNTNHDEEPMDIDDSPKLNITYDFPTNITQELKRNKSRQSFGLDLTECTLDCSIELCDISYSSGALPLSVGSSAAVMSPSLKKQNSFDMDESLGILTPDQMKEFLDSATTTTNLDLPINIKPSSTAVAGSKLVLHQMRIDQTPSPEDLPLDPVGVKTATGDIVVTTQPPFTLLMASAPAQNTTTTTYQEISQTDTYSKTDQMTKSNASKVSTSFITSVTSITSLDTGYIGDGEMSRPASRGPVDNSPSNGPRKPHLGRQPSFNQNNPIPIRRQDPMTDSDFFTESDADDIFNRGDRRAQVIDGQLYGPMLQPANVFITEQPQMEDSCMESSGIFTDVENRCDDELTRSRREAPSLAEVEADIDMSPDGSTDTVKSNNSEYKNQHKRDNSNTQRSISPMSQGNSNILTDSQTSSTIHSSISSERMINIMNTSSNGDGQLNAFESSTNNDFHGDGALDEKQQQKTNVEVSNDKKSSSTLSLINNECKHKSTTEKSDFVNTNQQQLSTLPSSLVRKVNSSRKQQSNSVIAGNKQKQNDNKTIAVAGDNKTKPGNNSIPFEKSLNIDGNNIKKLSPAIDKKNHNEQCKNGKTERVKSVNNYCDRKKPSSISGSVRDISDMLEKSNDVYMQNKLVGQQENNKRLQSSSPSSIQSPGSSLSSPTTRKNNNKWDAIMNKIAENKAAYKKNYSEVKSKVATGVIVLKNRTSKSNQLSNEQNQLDLLNIKSPTNSGKSVGSNCDSLNSVVITLASPSPPKSSSLPATSVAAGIGGKRTSQQSATKRGRSYSKDSQRSSQSDLSLTGGSPKLLSKLSGTSRSAKKRDVRTLSISPTDLGPPPKTQTNTSLRTKQPPQTLSQKRLSVNIQQVSNNKNSPPPAKKPTTRRFQVVQQQQSNGKTPLKDHNRVLGSNQSHNNNHHQQQLQQLNSSPKTISSSPTVNSIKTTSLQQINEGEVNNKTEFSTTLSPHTLPVTATQITNNELSPTKSIAPTTTPSNNLQQSVQNHKKQHHNVAHSKQQQHIKDSNTTTEQKSLKESALEYQLEHTNKSVEVLGVLLQYLAYDLDAFVCPSVKKDYKNAQKDLIETRLLLEDAKSSCFKLEDQLQDKEQYYTARESELQSLHQCELKKLENSLNELDVNTKERIDALEKLLSEKDVEYKTQLEKQIQLAESRYAEYEKQIQLSKGKEEELLKRISVLSATENDLREKAQISEENYTKRLQDAAQKERELNEKISTLTKQFNELCQKTVTRERELEEKLNLTQDEINVLRLSRNSFDQVTLPKNGSTVNGGPTSTIGGGSSANKIQMLQNEVESLRSVLELKQSEISELRVRNQEMQRAADEVPALQMKLSAFESRVEDLQIQLKAKNEEEIELIQKNKHLQESLSHEINNRTRLSLHNEQLQWRLKQNSEKFALTLSELSKTYQEQCSESLFNSSKMNNCSQDSLDLSQNFSFISSSRINGSNIERKFEADDESPPPSPIIKGVVEKSDSVSWVLEMDDETPEVLASRMVRRAGSFRLNFNEKSPGGCMKRQYASPSSSTAAQLYANPLSQSASAASILRQHSNDSSLQNDAHHFHNSTVSSRTRSKSVTIKSPEAKKIIRQSSIESGTSRKSEPPIPTLSLSWKEPSYCSTPYIRRPSSASRSPPKDISSRHQQLKVSDSNGRERKESFNTDSENVLFNQKHEPNLITCDTSALTSDAAERIEMRTLSQHSSVQDLKSLKKKCQEIQESAGEAMVSGTNSEDEGCSASSDEAFVLLQTSTISETSSSSTTASSTSSFEPEANKQNNLSTTCSMFAEKLTGNGDGSECGAVANSLNGTPMEVSWSDDGEHFPSESIV